MHETNKNRIFDNDPYDPDEIVFCPYFKQHQMPAKRLPYHMKKCSDRYGGEQYINCPLNRRHVVTVDQLKSHLLECPNKSIVLKLTEDIPDDVYEIHKCSIQVTISNEDEWGCDDNDKDVNSLIVKQSIVDIHPNIVNTSLNFIYNLSPELCDKILNAGVKSIPYYPNSHIWNYKSLLTIYCQVSHVKIPVYYEVSDPKYKFRNYASKCVVFNRSFYSASRCTTILQSQQDAAKWALIFGFIRFAPKNVYEEFLSLDNKMLNQNNGDNIVGKPAFKNA